MKVEADGFIGTVMAIESIADAAVLLHGPDGCRKNLSVLSARKFPRENGCSLDTPFYRGLPKVPCTGLSSLDYIHGSYLKVSDGLASMRGYGYPLIAVVCTPGASLIGDDISKAVAERGMEDSVLVIGDNHMSESLNSAWDVTICEALDKIWAGRGARTRKETVNLLGLSILLKDWPTVVDEFTRIMSMMGLEVVSCPGAGSSVEALASSAEAEFNVALYPDNAALTSAKYLREYGIPTVSTGCAPVGFDETERLIHRVADVTGRDPAKALDYIRVFKERAYRCMVASEANVDGRTFSVWGDPCVVSPLTSWLHSSLRMMPVSVCYTDCTSEDCRDGLASYLSGYGLEDVIGADSGAHVDYLFCDGNTAHTEEMAGCCGRGVDIMFPSKLTFDFRPSPILGPSGAMYLLDSIINPF